MVASLFPCTALAVRSCSVRVCYGTLGVTILTCDLSTAPRNQLRERHQGRLGPDSGRASVLASRPLVRLSKVWALFQQHAGFEIHLSRGA
jgi:hypothetical protein